MSFIKNFFSKENLFISGGIILGFIVYNKFIAKYLS